MGVAVPILLFVAAVTLVAGLSERFGLNAPIVLTLAGVAVSLVPGVPEVRLQPDVVLVGFLPPLLYAAAIRSSLVDFKANRRAIGLPIWVFPARYLLIRPAPDTPGGDPIPWTSTAIVGWAGTRGVVTLAAALILPPYTPNREVLVLAALVVVGGTLLAQGLTLTTLARRLHVRGPDPREDALQEATVLQAAVNAGLAQIEQTRGSADEEVVRTLRDRALSRTKVAWERLGNEEGEETPSEAYRRLRMLMLQAERAEVLRIRSQGVADHEVLATVMASLDLEESMLDRSAARTERLRDEPLEARVLTDQGCEHLQAAAPDAAPTSPDGCTGCLQEGTAWVHLRICLTCGYIGCCDSSTRRHATAHYHQFSHPVMRSFEPGEAWRWCYVDELLG